MQMNQSKLLQLLWVTI